MKTIVLLTLVLMGCFVLTEGRSVASKEYQIQCLIDPCSVTICLTDTECVSNHRTCTATCKKRKCDPCATVRCGFNQMCVNHGCNAVCQAIKRKLNSFL